MIGVVHITSEGKRRRVIRKDGYIVEYQMILGGILDDINFLALTPCRSRKRYFITVAKYKTVLSGLGGQSSNCQ